MDRQTIREQILVELESQGFDSTNIRNTLGKIYNLVNAFAGAGELVANRVAQITTQSETHSYFSVDYLAERILAYEPGKQLVVSSIDREPIYESIDINNRLVSNVSIEENSSRIFEVKVAKQGATSLLPLTSEELGGLQAYIGNIVLIGTDFALTSGEANTLQFNISIRVDNITLTSNTDGEIIRVDDGSEVLNGYISDFVNQFNSNSFDSVFQLSKLLTYLLAIEGISDAYVSDNMLTRYVGNVATTETRNISSTTGYFKVFSPDPDNTQSLTYTLLT